jgi:hypothetical protein
MVVAMKADELLKRLENIKTVEDERREIAEYLAKAVYDKRMLYLLYVMMKDRTIYDFRDYRDLLKSNRVSPNNAHVYLENNYSVRYGLVSYLYPFLHQGVPLVRAISLMNAYLSKLGFENKSYPIAPATGLKYIALLYRSPDGDRIAVEIVDINTVTTNTHLLSLIHNVLGTNYITCDKVEEITSQFISQKLFAGHTFIEAQDILYEYYEGHDTSLAKEVEAIKDAYNHIFQPYRVVYDLKTKQFQVSGNNENR